MATRIFQFFQQPAPSSRSALMIRCPTLALKQIDLHSDPPNGTHIQQHVEHVRRGILHLALPPSTQSMYAATCFILA